MEGKHRRRHAGPSCRGGMVQSKKGGRVIPAVANEKQQEDSSPTTPLVTQLALLSIQLADEEPNPSKLDKIRELNVATSTIRSKRTPSSEALKHEERMTKEFFRHP
eukprot:scaffold42201_cov35-Tisochrysis_lutea.AAC.1